MKANNSAGFTLIEVLIALVILAISAFVIVRTSQSSIKNSEHLTANIAAHMVGQNALAKLQTGLTTFPQDESSLTGSEIEFRHRWFWQATITATGSKKDSQYARVNLTVSRTSGGATVTTIIGFIHKPKAQDNTYAH